MSFEPEVLRLLAEAREVRIETQRPGSALHSTIIWVVVDGDDAFIRSWRGAGARWYREAVSNPQVGLVVDGQRVPATAVPATDGESIRRCSERFLTKYRKSKSAQSMVAEDILNTTLRLEPS